VKPEELSEALGEIDQSYITEAAAYRRHRLGWIPWVAACAALAVLWTIWSPLSGWYAYDPADGTASFYSRGVPVSLPLVTQGGEGMVLNSVRIDLDIQEFPVFPDLDSYLNFDSTTNMDLELYNPGSEPMTVTMMVPCGTDPLYAYNYDYETDTALFHAARERYCFYRNGESLDAALRVTNDDTPPVTEENWTTRYVTPDTTVTKYACRITELEQSENPLAAIWGPPQYSPVRGLLVRDKGYEIINTNFRVVVPAAIGKELVVYIVGDAPDYHLGWHFVGHDKKTPIDGAVELVDTQVMTFREFAMESFPEDWGIPEADWAYAMAETISAPTYYGGNSPTLSRPYRWYQLDLTIQPGETVNLFISLPLYPDSSSSGTIYNLDLDSLRALNPQGEQMLVLDTPKIIAQSNGEFSTDGTPYSLNLESVSGSELTFSLSTPRTTVSHFNGLSLWISGTLGGIAGFLLWYLIRRKKDAVC